MKKPKVMFLYLDNFKHLKKMSAEDVGRLMLALMDYAESGALPDLSDNTTLDVLFGMMAEQVSRDFEKYDEICRKRSKAGRISAEKRNKTKPISDSTHVNTCKQEKEKQEDKKEEKNKYEDEYEYENEYEEEKEKNQDAHGADSSRARSDLDIISPTDGNSISVSDATDAELSQLSAVVEHLNQVAGTHYRAETFCAKKEVIDRLREGYTADDLKAVTDKKYHRLLSLGFKKRSVLILIFGSCFKSFLDERSSDPDTKRQREESP